MKKKYRKLSTLIILAGLLTNGIVCAQDKATTKLATDTTKVKSVEGEVKSDRNIMLNASKSNEPREVNIGLPASVGGTTVLENGLPVVYYYWPELSSKAWRQDAMINKNQLLDLGQTAIKTGEVGFSVSTFDNLGTDTFKGTGRLSSNHFGLLRGELNLSGPLNKRGLKFSAGAYLNFDPGTFKAKGLPKYYSDKTQMYKGALTQDYNFQGGKGSLSLMYKYIDTHGVRNSYAPFVYKKDGKIEEVEGFKMGRDSYYENTGKITVKDAFTGEYETRDVTKDTGTDSHTFDLLWKNTLNNGLYLNLVSRYHVAHVGTYFLSMTGVSPVVTPDKTDKYIYADNGEAYTGSSVQGALALIGKKRPIKTLMSTFEIGKKSGKHEWSVGINEWFYSIDKYVAEGAIYYHEIAPNPRKLLKVGSNYNEYGNLPGGLDYHNGNENKTAIFITDKWDISKAFTLNLGARLEYQNIRGDYQDRNLKLDNLNGPKTKIKEDWLNKAFTLNAIYRMTNTFGLLGDVTYNEKGGNLDNFTVGTNPNIKQSKIPSAGFGFFYNHPMLSLISKATYIQRDEYRAAPTFTNPNDATDIKRDITSYTIQTLGWTTDVVATPFKGFNLHFLVTVQAPKYKDFAGSVTFNDGSIKEYNYNDKSVTGISKVLLEIDPSYTWKDLRVWASARYFSKRYLNKPNTFELEARWETFAGANYKINKNLSLNVTVVNLLNQFGASGSIPGGDLITTEEEAAKRYNSVMSGSYMRPFTVEFGAKFNF